MFPTAKGVANFWTARLPPLKQFPAAPACYRLRDYCCYVSVPQQPWSPARIS